MTETPAKRARVDDNDLPLDLSINRQQASIELPRSESPNFNLTENSPLISPYFLPDIPSSLIKLELELTKIIGEIVFGAPVEYVYCPIEYAYSVHFDYLQKFCQNQKKILLLGMNPGPWGMSQTGVPFGEIDTVVNWLKLSGSIGQPAREQADRRITGFSCKRSEVSGKRFWNLFKKICGSPEVFFEQAFLRNYCPVALMDAGGRNITPAELKGPEQIALRDICDWFLAESIKLLGVEKIVGIGRFAEQRAKSVVRSFGLSTSILWLPHPSPRSTGREDWSVKALKILSELNLLQFFCNDENLGRQIK